VTYERSHLLIDNPATGIVSKRENPTAASKQLDQIIATRSYDIREEAIAGLLDGTEQTGTINQRGNARVGWVIVLSNSRCVTIGCRQPMHVHLGRLLAATIEVGLVLKFIGIRVRTVSILHQNALVVRRACEHKRQATGASRE